MRESGSDVTDCPFCSFPIALGTGGATGDAVCPGCGARGYPRDQTLEP